MGYYSEQQVLALLAIVFVLIAQCQSTTVYKCNNETNVCGCSRRPHVSLKINGGQSALFSNWDWIVSIRNLNYHFCGGSILNEWYIITAAHCFENRTNITSSMTVCAGTFRLSDPCHQRRTIDSVIFHPLYNRTTVENDIALVRLTTPLDFSDYSLTPICLPSVDYPNEYPAVGTQVVSIGWGDLKTNTTPDVLQQVPLQIMSKSSTHCNHLNNDRIQLCAGDLGKGISKGDSGGPLMVLKASKRWELIGMASFIKRNANPQSGSGYTLITPFVQFIQRHIRKPSIYPTILNCSCQCPRGFDTGYAYSTINSLDGCVNACMAVASNSCISSNTYACLGTDCTYSNSYNVSTIAPIQDDQAPLAQTVLISNGNKYEGQTKDGKRHGRGTYTWSTGEKYVGDWFDGSITGKGIYTWPDGIKYEGQFKDSAKHGQGTQIWSNGNKYVGDWVDNSKTGKGIFTWLSGHKYVGDWVADSKTGKGTYTWPSGDKYVGDWIDDNRTGKGVYIDSIGNRYVGDWIDDIRTGKGVMTLFNGDKYEGEFKDDKKHGRGTYNLVNDNKYVGDWVEDSMEGEGVYTWSDGDKYEGHFENGEMNGWGKMRYSNGTIQTGLWPNGPFTYY